MRKTLMMLVTAATLTGCATAPSASTQPLSPPETRSHITQQDTVAITQGLYWQERYQRIRNEELEEEAASANQRIKQLEGLYAHVQAENDSLRSARTLPQEIPVTHTRMPLTQWAQPTFQEGLFDQPRYRLDPPHDQPLDFETDGITVTVRDQETLPEATLTIKVGPNLYILPFADMVCQEAYGKKCVLVEDILKGPGGT